MSDFEIIKFSFAGLNLQEPMTLLINCLVAVFCLYALLKIRWNSSYSVKAFRSFLICLALSMFIGALGHSFFQYWGVFGKLPSWFFGILAGFYLGQGILFYWKEQKSYSFFTFFLIFKALILFSLSIIFQKFIFVAIDVILTYLIYSGYISYHLWKKDKVEMKFFVYGIIVLFPSMFVFLLNINLHRYFNRDDLSHLLMLFCIIFFYSGIKKINDNYSQELSA